MKQVVLLLLFWCSTLAGCAQQPDPVTFPLDPKTHRITYSGEVPMAGVSLKELIARAQAWEQAISKAELADRQPDAWELPTRPGEERKGKATGYGARLLPYTIQGNTRQMPVYYTVRLLLRAGTYRYEVTDFFFVYGYPGGPAEQFLTAALPKDSEARYPGYLDQVAALRTAFPQLASSIIAKLQEAMSKPVTETKIPN